jgi:carboxypeptidase Q
MHRCRIASLVERTSPLRRLPQQLAVLTILAVAALGWGQGLPVVPPIPPSAKASTVSSVEALSLDRKIIAEAKEGSEIMANLTYLSDMIGPRLTGSAALKRANDWTAEKMRSYGLTNVHLEAYTIPMGWERGIATGRIIEPDNGCKLSLAASGWTPGTKGKIEGDVVILSARTSADLAALRGKLRNAIILRGPPANIRPITDTSFAGGRDGSPFGQGGAPGQRRQRGFGQMMGFRRELMEFLRSEGAAAVLQDAGKPHGLLTAGGGWQGLDRPSAADPMPSLFVAHEHYALLYRLASRPAPARTRIELEVSNRFIPGPIAVYNTAGEIRGSEKPDEYVILGAHLVHPG